MPRRELWNEAACYHVMNRGHNRETIFADDADRRYFLGLVGRYRQRFDLRLYHYCLMDNRSGDLASELRACRQAPESRRQLSCDFLLGEEPPPS